MTTKPVLRFEETYAAILAAARKRKFVTYGELAAASGVPWKQAWRPIAGHLDRFTEFTYQRDCPLLSSIVVNQANSDSGAIEGEQLEGLLKAAAMVDLSATNPQTFVREQQERVFTWATTAPEHLGTSAQP